MNLNFYFATTGLVGVKHREKKPLALWCKDLE